MIGEVKQNWKTITVTVVGGAAIIGYALGLYDVPAWTTDLVIAAVIISPWAFLLGRWLGEPEQPPLKRVMEIDSHRKVIWPWLVPEHVWDEREEVDGEAYHYKKKDVWGVRKLEWDEEDRQLRVRAPWRGEATDAEIETHDDAVYQTRSEWRHKVRVANRIIKKWPTMLDAAAQDYYESETRQFARKGDLDEGVVMNQIDRQIRDVQQEIAEIEDVEDEELLARELIREMGEDPDEWSIQNPQSDFDRVRETVKQEENVDAGDE